MKEKIIDSLNIVIDLEWRKVEIIVYRVQFYLGLKKIDLHDVKEGILSLQENGRVELKGDLSDFYSCEVRAFPLKAIGFWKSGEESKFIHPEQLVGHYQCKERNKLLNYLDSGVIFEGWFGYSYCRFDCGICDTNMGSCDLTDGVWLWPQGLSHYVRDHDIVLPSEFMKHVKRNHWKIPDITPPQLDMDSVDFSYWTDYCQNQKGAYAPPLDCKHITQFHCAASKASSSR